MRRRTLSAVFAGAAFVVALTLVPAPASAAGREPGCLPERLELRRIAGWLGGAWTRAVEAISWTIDPDGSTVNGSGEPPPQPAGDVSLMIDPDG